MPFIQISHVHHHHYPDQRQQHADIPLLLDYVRKIMSQLDDLQSALTAAQGDLDEIKSFVAGQADKITSLTQQLAQLSQTVPPQVDLSGVTATAQSLKEEADAIVASFAPPSSGTSSGAGAGTASADTSAAGAGETTGAAGASASDGSAGTADAGSGTAAGDAGGTVVDESAGTSAASGAAAAPQEEAAPAAEPGAPSGTQAA